MFAIWERVSWRQVWCSWEHGYVLGSPLLGNRVEVVEYCEFPLARWVGAPGLEVGCISISGELKSPSCGPHGCEYDAGL